MISNDNENTRTKKYMRSPVSERKDKDIQFSTKSFSNKVIHTLKINLGAIFKHQQKAMIKDMSLNI